MAYNPDFVIRWQQTRLRGDPGSDRDELNGISVDQPRMVLGIRKQQVLGSSPSVGSTDSRSIPAPEARFIGNGRARDP